MAARSTSCAAPAPKLITALAQAAGAKEVCACHAADAAAPAVEAAIREALVGESVELRLFSARLLHEPGAVRTKSGGGFKVFTPFWRAVQAGPPPPPPRPAPKAIEAVAYPNKGPERVALDALALLPRKPDWAGGLRAMWRPGEEGARVALQAFVAERLARYAVARDRPGEAGTSRFSPHLRFGEIGPRQIHHALRQAAETGEAPRGQVDAFEREIAWRDFCYGLLAAHPDLATRNIDTRFDAFPWRDPKQNELSAWRRGATGFPIVDAGMRQLWRTGFMENRVRMICASFLIKDLLVDWRVGEAWFWDTLCDADPADNSANWQWVAGSGADPSPFFRVFNPVLQGEKFDPQGDYVRAFVPELAELPDRWIHKPWEAPAEVMRQAGIALGRDYPAPIVDHAAARDRALAALRLMRGSSPQTPLR